jgi:protein-tyrosine phosphatase
VFSFFKKEEKNNQLSLGTDVHSHLLANIDDGVKSMAEAETIILEFKKLGYSKLITTPHIMSDHYRNDAVIINSKLEALRNHLHERKIEMQVDAAAEYYFDEVFYQQVNANEKFLTFGKSYLLFETNYLSEPYQLKDFIFKITTQGYQPVLAHPERYQYMTIEKAEDLRSRGVLFQINILSLLGYYSKPIRSMAYEFIDKGWIDFLGSDCHNYLQIREMEQAYKNKYFKKALDLPLLNRMI